MPRQAVEKGTASVIKTANQPKVAGNSQPPGQDVTQGPKDHSQASFRHFPSVNEQQGIGGQESQGVSAEIQIPKWLGERMAPNVEIPSQGQRFEDNQPEKDRPPVFGFSLPMRYQTSKEIGITIPEI